MQCKRKKIKGAIKQFIKKEGKGKNTESETEKDRTRSPKKFQFWFVRFCEKNVYNNFSV